MGVEACWVADVEGGGVNGDAAEGDLAVDAGVQDCGTAFTHSGAGLGVNGPFFRFWQGGSGRAC